MVWSGEGEAEDTFEEVGGRLDGWMGEWRGRGTGTGVESVATDGAPGDQRWKVGSCSCDEGLFRFFHRGCSEAGLDIRVEGQGGGASEGG